MPMEFATLVDELALPAMLRQEISRLTADKRAGTELGRGPRIPVIRAFIDGERKRLEKSALVKSEAPALLAPMNDFFRATLQEVWKSDTM